MTRTLVRSLIAITAVTAGCTVNEISEPGTGIAGTGPVSVTGVAGMCGGNNFNSGPTGGGVAAPMRPGFGNPFTPQGGTTRSAPTAPPAISGGTLVRPAAGNPGAAAPPGPARPHLGQ